MDGNGRWAKRRGLPRLLGHKAGLDSVRRMVRHCGTLGIETLTLYTFSTENWSRPRPEVSGLMRLLADTTRREIEDLHENNVRVLVQGRMHELPKPLRDVLQRAIETTRDNTGLTLNLAINYSGRAEIADAAKELARRAASGELDPESIGEPELAAAMYHPSLGDPDLLIRTGGEMRVSNFLLWQIAYTELWVTEVLWPDFDEELLDQAISDFGARERRFGGTKD
jgi:undecaprenyl diphosphate synthase